MVNIFYHCCFESYEETKISIRYDRIKFIPIIDGILMMVVELTDSEMMLQRVLNNSMITPILENDYGYEPYALYSRQNKKEVLKTISDICDYYFSCEMDIGLLKQFVSSLDS